MYIYYSLEYFQNMIIFIIVIPTRAVSVPHENQQGPSQGEEVLKRKMFPGVNF
jgi:hypothetical protein